jgi:hypothetical protein
MDLRQLDLPGIADRYYRTFKRENHDRPVLNISYPIDPKKHAVLPPAPPNIRDQWFDFEWRLDCHERQLENTGFMLEGFPHFNCNLGPDILAACTGSELDFAPGTSWAKFRVKDWKETPPIRFQPDGYYWKEMARFLTLSATRGAGRWLTQSGDLHSNGDGLAALRGPQDLLMDLFDCPVEIHKRLAECHAVYEAMLQAHFDILHPLSGGFNSSWCSAAVKGRFATIQNDFCCMVGPGQFDEFFKDYVEKEAAFLDCCIYHLDGPGAIRHLDSICQAPHLDLIQWVPGDGNKPVCQWPDLLKRIQSLGKGLWLYGTAGEQLEMMEFLKPEGCLYNVWVGSREEAEAFAKKAVAIHRAKRSATITRP